MAGEKRERCPTCDETMEYVKRYPSESEIQSGAERFSIPLDSHIWRCPEHGLWRISMNGEKVAIVESPKATE